MTDQAETDITRSHQQREPQSFAIKLRPNWSSGAVRFVNDWLTRCKGPRVLEFGSGGSTLYLAQSGCNVIAIEHHEKWHQAVVEKLSQLNLSASVDVRLVPRPYASVSDEFPNGSFDIVLVDGRGRVDCIRSSARLVKPGGFLLLDDSQRRRYQVAKAELREWPSQTFADPKHETTVWRRDLNFEEQAVAPAHTDGDATPNSEGNFQVQTLDVDVSRIHFDPSTDMERKLVQAGYLKKSGPVKQPRVYSLRNAHLFSAGPDKLVFRDEEVFSELTLGNPPSPSSLEKPQIRADRILDLTSPGAALFSFFLFDTIPKYLVARELGHSGLNFDYVLVNTSAEYAMELLELVGVPAHKVISRNNARSHFYASELLVVGQVRAQRVVPPWMKIFLDDAIRRPPDTLHNARRIYISRENSNGRRVVNKRAFEALLSDHGFECVFAEKLKVLEMQKIMASSSVVVSPHGAGLANIIFAPPGSRIIELFGLHYTPQYRNLAKVCNQDYLPFSCRGEDGRDLFDVDSSKERAQDVNRFDMVVDLQLFDKALQQFLHSDPPLPR